MSFVSHTCYRVFSVTLLFSHKFYLDSCHLLEHTHLAQFLPDPTHVNICFISHLG